MNFVNPEKKLAVLTRGFTLARNMRVGRFLIDATKAGFNQDKILKLHDDLDRFLHWSNFNKPDIDKIQNSKLINHITWLYRDGSLYGNGSVADAIRYERITGLQIENTWHESKGRQTIIDIGNLIEWKVPWTPILADSDKNIATQLKKDLERAIAGQ